MSDIEKKIQDRKKHYSYSVYNHREVAEQFDKDKFSGEIGELIRKRQESLIEKYLPEVQGLKILDVGAGTGRISLPLRRRGADIAGVDASCQMLAIARDKAWLQGCPIKILRADAHDLPFPSLAYDCVISLRTIMHVIDWRRMIEEICRVSAKTVIVDFPPRSGVAGLAPFVHPFKRLLTKNYQPYRVFSIKEIVSEFKKNGFHPVEIDRHLVLPFALHRLIGQASFTSWIEGAFQKIGLRDLLGSPVTIMAQRE